MKFSKTILSVAVAAAMVGAAGHVFAQPAIPDANNPNNSPNNSSMNPGGATGGSSGTMERDGRMNNNRGNMQGGGATNRDGTSAGSNNPNNNPMNSSGAIGGTDNRVSGAPGTMDSSGRMRNDSGNMSNRTMRDGGTGAVGQSSSRSAGERTARADRN